MGATENKVVSIDRANVSKVDRSRISGNPLLSSARAALERNLSRVMRSLFDSVDDDLYDRAERSKDSSMADRFFSAMREIRLNRKTVEQVFVDSCLEHFDKFWAKPAHGQPGLPTAGLGELSLVDDSDLEENLAISGVASKVEYFHKEVLFALEQRIGHVADGRAVTPQDNPVGPRGFCEAFRKASKTLDMDLTIRLVLYKLFERDLIAGIGALYDELNVLFVQAGVLPHLTYKPRNLEHAGGARRQRRTRPKAREPLEDEDDDWQGHEGVADTVDSVAPDVFQGLFKLLSERRGDGSGRKIPGGGAAVAAYAPTEIINTLSGLQTGLGNDAATAAGLMLKDSDDLARLSPEDFKTILLTQMPGGTDGSARRIGGPEEDTIDVVGMLFEFILNDQNLRDPMRVLIGRLQIPIIKVAIIDRSFFGATQHPARRLLNELAQAAIGWVEEDGREPGGLYGRIEHAVERILNEFTDNADLFPEVLEEFQVNLAADAERIEKQLSQETRRVENRERLAIGQELVSESLDQRLKASPVPDSVRNVILDAWPGLMVTIYLRQGEFSEAWSDALKVVDTLLWSLQPKPNNEERQRLIKTIPSLLKALRSGFNRVSYDAKHTAEFFSLLQSLHLDVLKGIRVCPEPEPAVSAEVASALDELGESMDALPDVESEDDTSQGMSDFSFDEHFRQAETLMPGAWVELTLEDGKPQRAKLAWRSEYSANCLFVKRNGTKVDELTTNELAQRLREGKARILETVPLIDRALDTIGRVLRTVESRPESGHPAKA